jgi:hypothetical protein
MYAYQEFALGILVIHAFLCLAFVLGSLLLASDRRDSDAGGEALDIVVSVGTGIAAIGIATFFFGLVGLLTPLGFLVLLALLAGGSLVAMPAGRTRAFWSYRLALVARALSRPGLWLLWLALVVLAFPATEPPTAFDAIFYHQVYALEWAQQHRLVVDLFRRFPWYASNWMLIFTWFEVFGLGRFAQFAGWAAGALGAVLGYALVYLRLRRSSAPFADLAAALAALPFVSASVFLRWWDSGMNDVPIGFFFFLAVVVCSASVVSPSRRMIVASVIVAAFFIGMKPTLPFFFPLFALLAMAAARGFGMRWRGALAVALAMAALSSPWYIKNIIQDGDPAPPILHMYLHRDDRSMSIVDAENITSDMVTDHSPETLALLPFRFYESPDTNEFREFGSSFAALFLGLPILVLAAGLLTNRRNEIAYWAAALATAYAYWILTAHYGRYALLFYPLLCIFLICLLLEGTDRLRARSAWSTAVPAASAIAALAAVILAMPTQSSLTWMQQFVAYNFTDTPILMTSDHEYLERTLPGYKDEEAVTAWLDRHPDLPRNVLSFRLESLAYSFAEDHIQSIGDWVGPERYTDFATAIAAGNAATYVRKFDASAVIVPKHNEILNPAAISNLKAQLEQAGFQQIPASGDDDTETFVRRGA